MHRRLALVLFVSVLAPSAKAAVEPVPASVRTFTKDGSLWIEREDLCAGGEGKREWLTEGATVDVFGDGAKVTGVVGKTARASTAPHCDASTEIALEKTTNQDGAWRYAAPRSSFRALPKPLRAEDRAALAKWPQALSKALLRLWDRPPAAEGGLPVRDLGNLRASSWRLPQGRLVSASVAFPTATGPGKETRVGWFKNGRIADVPNDCAPLAPLRDIAVRKNGKWLGAFTVEEPNAPFSTRWCRWERGRFRPIDTTP